MLDNPFFCTPTNLVKNTVCYGIILSKYMAISSLMRLPLQAVSLSLNSSMRTAFAWKASRI